MKKIIIPKGCPICYGYPIKMFKSSFIRLCKHKMKGEIPRSVILRKEKNLISYNKEVCATCPMGALVLAGKDIPSTETITFIG